MPTEADLEDQTGGAEQAGLDATPNDQRRLALRVTLGGLGVAGLAISIILIVRSGVGQVLDVLGTAGWSLLLLPLLHMVTLGIDAKGWRILLGHHPRAPLSLLTWVAAVREAVNGLLPVARVGGEVVGVRLVALRGVPAARVGASVVVEITITLIVQLLFTALGVVILLGLLGNPAAARAVLIGLAASLPVVALFLFLQHRVGLFQLIERALVAIAGRTVLGAVGDPAALDREIQALYRRTRDVLACGAWQTGTMLAGVGETWVALRLLGHPSSLLTALMIESFAQGVQSLFFMVPGTAGAQEGGYLLFGGAAGLTPDVALALSLARRVRLFGFGVPALLSWQWVEGGVLRRKLADWRKSP